MESKTHLEEFIEDLYRQVDVLQPTQLDSQSIAKHLNFHLVTLPISPMHINSTIFLDNRVLPAQQWQDFGHEMCHALFHAGNQHKTPLSFRQYQEWKANNFMYEFCVPEFMLREVIKDIDYHPINAIIEQFNVTPEFAIQRYEKYMMKRYQEQLDQQQLIAEQEEEYFHI